MEGWFDAAQRGAFNMEATLDRAYERGKRREEDDFLKANRLAGEEAARTFDSPAANDATNPERTSRLSPEDRMTRVAMARADHALTAGRWDAFTQHWNAAQQMRAVTRTRKLNQADQKFAASGDYNAYLDAYNALDDGITLKEIRRADMNPVARDDEGQALPRAGNQFVLVADVGGKRVEKTVDEDALKGILMVLRDPAAARQVEAQYAVQTREHLLKRGDETHKANLDILKKRDEDSRDPAKRILKVGKDETAIDLHTGGSFQGVGEGKADPQQRLLDNDVVQHVMRIEGMGAKNLIDNTEHLTGAGEQLANRATLVRRAAPHLPVTEAVKVAKEGKVGTGTLRRADGTTYTGPVIQHGGRSYPLAALEDAPQRPPLATPPFAPPGAAPAGRPAPAGGRPPEFTMPNVTPGQQAARDSDRVRILEDELAAEQQRLAQAQREGNAAQAAKIQGDIEALQREVGRASGGQPRAAATPAQVMAANPVQARARMGQRAIENAAPMPDAREAAGIQLETARAAFARANAAVQSFGQAQRQRNPQGFAAAQAEQQRAAQVLAQAEAAYQATFSQGEKQAFQRPGQPAVAAR